MAPQEEKRGNSKLGAQDRWPEILTGAEALKLSLEFIESEL
jgi:hypothetical protein